MFLYPCPTFYHFLCKFILKFDYKLFCLLSINLKILNQNGGPYFMRLEILLKKYAGIYFGNFVGTNLNVCPIGIYM
jgi:hypothetical protein